MMTEAFEYFVLRYNDEQKLNTKKNTKQKSTS